MGSLAHDFAWRLGNDLPLDTFIELYRASTPGERRPLRPHSKVVQSHSARD